MRMVLMDVRAASLESPPEAQMHALESRISNASIFFVLCFGLIC
jgi:hypothetical protein